MNKNVLKNGFPSQIQLSRNNINNTSNNNFIFEQNKINNFYQVGYQGFKNINKIKLLY